MTRLLIFGAAVAALVASTLALSHFLGERRRGKAQGEPYESGIPPTGSARGRMTIGYFGVAVCFVLFDVESAFLYAWAASARETGRAGTAALTVFVGILLAALAYLARTGSLEPGASGHRRTP